ncbi:MAG: ECF transporter S component [Acetanaerobacterium sp.]
MQANNKTRQLTYVAMFSAISAVLMYLEFPLPFMPPFLKVDLSGIPILLAAFMLGPVQAVFITLIKDLIHLLSTQTGGVGELADFLMLSALAVTAHYIYRYSKTKKGALLACMGGSVAAIAIACLSNYFLLIPFYSKIMPIDAIIGACAAVNPFVNSIEMYILLAVVPFNIIKCFILSFVTMLTYKKLSRLLKTSIPV